MIVVQSTQKLFDWRNQISQNSKIGFVPTMGGLHSGHLSLIKKCLLGSDLSVVSLFLNPKQFSETEDLKTYPSNFLEDLKTLKELNVDVVFAPLENEIYADDDYFSVVENKISLLLEGNSRPSFFPGVLTVVSKLFNIIRPHNAYFGKKDAQQLLLIKQLVRHMKYPINVVECDTVREEGGLAMSSRNNYLTKEDRSLAKIIYLSLLEAKKTLSSGEHRCVLIKNHVTSILKNEKKITLDYISIANVHTLEEFVDIVDDDALISIAVLVSGVRLIDNVFFKKQ